MNRETTEKQTTDRAAMLQLAKESLRELDRNGEFPQSWRPTDGDQVEGTILRYSSTELPLSGPCQIAVIGQDDGEPLSVFVMGTVLVGEFEKKNPKVGERILIRYVGKHDKGYKKFVVALEREEEEAGDYRAANRQSRPVPEEQFDDPFIDDDAGVKESGSGERASFRVSGGGGP